MVLTEKQQKLLMDLLVLGKITRKQSHKRNTFCNDADFYHQIKILITWDWIKKNDMGYITEYQLTDMGKIVANILCRCDKNYRKYARRGIYEFEIE